MSNVSPFAHFPNSFVPWQSQNIPPYLKEIYPANAIASVNKVSGKNIMPMFHKPFAQMPLAATRFKDLVRYWV